MGAVGATALLLDGILLYVRRSDSRLNDRKRLPLRIVCVCVRGWFAWKRMAQQTLEVYEQVLAD